MAINYKGETITAYGKVNGSWYAIVDRHIVYAKKFKELCTVIGISGTALKGDVNRGDIK